MSEQLYRIDDYETTEYRTDIIEYLIEEGVLVPVDEQLYRIDKESSLQGPDYLIVKKGDEIGEPYIGALVRVNGADDGT